jgi:GH24 family phage-related lysozyme (muramidase)
MIKRQTIAALSLSAAAFVGLVLHEGYSDKAIIPVQGDRPTVGFGSTFREDGAPVQMGDTITPQKAIARTLAHIQKDERGIKSCVTAPLTQAEYDLMVDFSYQYGTQALCKSSIVSHANAGRYRQSCESYKDFRYMKSNRPIQGWQAFQWDAQGRPTRWRFDCSTPGNRRCAGVWNRSKDRYEKCMDGQK